MMTEDKNARPEWLWDWIWGAGRGTKGGAQG